MLAILRAPDRNRLAIRARMDGQRKKHVIDGNTERIVLVNLRVQATTERTIDIGKHGQAVFGRRRGKADPLRFAEIRKHLQAPLCHTVGGQPAGTLKG